MIYLAILQNEETLLNKLSNVSSDNFIGLLNFDPTDKLRSKFSDIILLKNSDISLLNQTNIWNNKPFDISVPINKTLADTFQIEMIAKCNSKSDLHIFIYDNGTKIAETHEKIEKLSLYRISMTIDPINIEIVNIRLINKSKSTITIVSMKCSMHCNLSENLIKNIITRNQIQNIVINDQNFSKICPKNISIINLNSTRRQKTLSNTQRIVSILTPTYNGLKYLKKCASNLLSNTNHDLFEWLILDDHSTDGTEEYVQEELFKYKQIKYIKPTERVNNFSKANNILAQDINSKYIVCLNNDCYVQPGWLEPLLHRMESDPTIGVAGSLLLFPNSRKIQHCGVIFFNFDELGPLPGHFLHEQNLDDNFRFVNTPRLYQSVTAACLITRTKLFRTIQGFDENYKFGYEDVDLCLQIKQLGYKILFEPSSVVEHEQGGTLDNNKKTKHQAFLNNKNIFQSKWKYTPILDIDLYANDFDMNVYNTEIFDGTVAYFPITRGFCHDIYRTDHAVIGLKENNIKTKIVDWKKPNWTNDISVVIFQRFSYTPECEIAWKTAKLKYPDAIFGYDIDDYIFDKQQATLSNLDIVIAKSAELYDIFMQRCDFFTTTTSYLASKIEKLYKKPVFVISNSITNEFIKSNKKEHHQIIIGYASGTPTHDRDFETVIPCLKYVLNKYPNVILRIIGPVEIPSDFFLEFNNKIQKFQFVQFTDFPNELSHFDINIAPLRITSFNKAKSPLKYIEAGAIGIPTVASNMDGYQEVIINGFNGFLATSQNEWIDYMSLLIEDKNTRRQIGENARSNVMNNFTTRIVGSYLKKVLIGICKK